MIQLAIANKQETNKKMSIGLSRKIIAKARKSAGGLELIYQGSSIVLNSAFIQGKTKFIYSDDEQIVLYSDSQTLSAIAWAIENGGNVANISLAGAPEKEPEKEPERVPGKEPEEPKEEPKKSGAKSDLLTQLISETVDTIIADKGAETERKMQETIQKIEALYAGQVEELEKVKAELIQKIEKAVPREVKFVFPDKREVKINTRHAELENVLESVRVTSKAWLWGADTGAGKSIIGRNIAEIMGAQHVPFACSNAMEYADITGFYLPEGYQPAPIAKAIMECIETGAPAVIVLEEFDNLTANTQVALNDAMDNRIMPIPCPERKHLKIPENVYFIITTNTDGSGATADYNGREKLDASVQARFTYNKHHICYDKELEYKLAEGDDDILSLVYGLRKDVQDKGIDLIIGTRHIRDAVLFRKAGHSLTAIKDRFLTALSADDRAKFA